MASGRFCPLWASLKGHVTREKHAFSRRHTCPGTHTKARRIRLRLLRVVSRPTLPPRGRRLSCSSPDTASVCRESRDIFQWNLPSPPFRESSPSYALLLIHTYIHIRSRVARAWIAVSIQRIDPVVYHSRQPSCIDGVCVMVKWRRSRFSLSLSLSLSLSPSPSLSLLRTIGPIWYARNVRGARCCVYKGTNSPLQIFELEGEGCRWKRTALECISRGRFNACLRALEALAAP